MIEAEYPDGSRRLLFNAEDDAKGLVKAMKGLEPTKK